MAETRRLLFDAPTGVAWIDYDPALTDELLDGLAALPVDGADPVAAELWAAGHLAILVESIHGWSFADPDGTALPVTVEEIGMQPFSVVGLIIGSIIADRWMRLTEGARL